MNKNLSEAIAELEKVKNVRQWNEVRKRHIPNLTREEISKIDSYGLIVKVLGKDIIHDH